MLRIPGVPAQQSYGALPDELCFDLRHLVELTRTVPAGMIAATNPLLAFIGLG